MRNSNPHDTSTESSFAPPGMTRTELLAAITESAGDVIISKTTEGIIMTWNHAAERVLGYAADEIVGKSVLMLIPDDRKDEESLILSKVRNGENIERYETVRVRKDGGSIDVSLTVSPITLADGTIIGASSILHDISKQKVIEQKRLEAETKLGNEREVVEAIHWIGTMLAAELDLDKLVQAVTDASTTLTCAEFGAFFYNVEDKEGGAYLLYTLSGAPPEAFSSFPMPRATELFGPTFRGERTIRIDDVKNDRRFGKNPPYHGMPPGHLPVSSYLAVPVIGKQGEVIGGLFFGHSKPGVFTKRHERIVEALAGQAAAAMVNARLYEKAQSAIRERDELLTREQSLREEAEMASRSKDEFLGLLSHELRTPLNAILGWASTIRLQKVEGEVLATALETIERSAKVQTRLIEDMLDLSRIVAGKLRLDVQPVDLTGVVNAAIEGLRPAAQAKQIRVSAVLNYGAGTVLGDPVRLQQVVSNLLSNAIKFTPKRGSVQISVTRLNSQLQLQVSDTGPGIDEEFLPYVFERFRQADSSPRKKHGGLGLGLTIVKQLVELHGGTVLAENRTDGTGALFTVALPVMAVSQRSEGLFGGAMIARNVLDTGATLDCPPGLDDLRILIVDDEPDARFLLSTFLEECGASVKACSSASEAFNELKGHEYDVLVSDIGMPDEDGYSLIEKVRSAEAGSGLKIPAIALTAYAGSADRMRALAAGYNMHVPKPVEPAELALVIASLTARL